MPSTIISGSLWLCVYFSDWSLNIYLCCQHNVWNYILCSCGEVCSHVAAIIFIFKIEACVRLVRSILYFRYMCLESSILKKCSVYIPQSMLFKQSCSAIYRMNQCLPLIYIPLIQTMKGNSELLLEQHESSKEKRHRMTTPPNTLQKTNIFNLLYKQHPQSAIFKILPGFNPPATAPSQSQPTAAPVTSIQSQPVIACLNH